MAKKRFTDGLESLFGGAKDAQAPKDRLPVLVKTTEGEPKPSDDPGKKSPGKNFSADLESFLSEVFEASFEEQLKNPSGKDAAPRKTQKTLNGLDALIRSTVSPDAMKFDSENTRRVTIVFDQAKLEKLKFIARTEKTMLRNIIDDIVRDYIARYEQRQQ